MICPQCQTENRDGAKFCDECGYALQGLSDQTPTLENEEAEEPALAVEPSGLPQSFDSIKDLPLITTDEASEREPEPLEDSAIDSEIHIPEIALDNEAGGAVVNGKENPESSVLAEASDDSAQDAALDTDAEEDTAGAELSLDDQPTQEIEKLDLEDDNVLADAEDFAGLEFSGFKPEDSSFETDAGDTMEMPAIGGGISGAKQTNFVAPGDAKAAKKQNKEQKRQAKLAAKEAKRAHGSGMGKGAKIALISVLGLLIVAGAAVFGTYQLEMWGGKTVPDVVGMTQTDATYLLESKGFSVRSTQVASDDTEGLVLLADPGIGSREPEGAEVVIHVAVSRTIPEIEGLSHDDALKALSDAGYDNISVTTQKSDEEEGKVLSVEPAVGSKAKSNAPITLVETEAYRIPKVAGLSWNDAKAAFEEAGFTTYYTEEYSETITSGTVIRTEPTEESVAKSGSEVVVVVAKSRGAELVALAQSELAGRSITASDGSTFTVSSVNAVAYQGSDTCGFTVTGTFSTSVTLGSETQSVTSSEQMVTGGIYFNSDNSISSIVLHTNGSN